VVEDEAKVARALERVAAREDMKSSLLGEEGSSGER
jgi:hypothetical protein